MATSAVEPSGPAGLRTAAGTRRVESVVVTGARRGLGDSSSGAGQWKRRPAPVRDGYSAEVRNRLGWEPTPGRFHLFSVDIQDVTFIRYEDASGDQFVTRWPAGGNSCAEGTEGPPSVILSHIRHC